MSYKHKTTRSVTQTLDEVFSGVITLNDMKARGIRDVIVIVIDENNKKHTLTTPGPTKERQTRESLKKTQECEHAPEGRTAQYIMSTSAVTTPNIPPEAQVGDNFTNSSDGCVWQINSLQTDGDLKTTTIECIGPDPQLDTHVPKCDNQTVIIDVKESDG